MNTVVLAAALPTGITLQLVYGDLTSEEVDAIVNPANARLVHGGGVAGMIALKGGLPIDEESRRWVREHGPVSHDRPAFTIGGNLPARYVIHAVGPVWGSGGEDAKLAAAVSGTLDLANELGLRTLSLPAISTGTFGFPMPRAARIILHTLKSRLSEPAQSTLQQVRVVLYDRPALETFQQAWSDLGLPSPELPP
jgi:O-acetyl-ADP-ribose deacetylase